MFDNVGKSIKFVSKILFYVLLALSIAFGIILFFDSNLWWLGIVVTVFGPFFDYVISLTLYGYGEIVDSKQPKKKNKFKNKKNRREYLEDKLLVQVKCLRCGKLHDYDDRVCPECGYEHDIKEFDSQEFFCPKCGYKHEFGCSYCPKCKYKYDDFE